MKKLLALAFIASSVTMAHAALVYDNLPATGSYFTSSTRPNYMVDDFDMAPVGSNLATQITGMNLTFNANSAANIDILVSFYQDLNFAAGAADNIFGAQSPVASFLLTGISVTAAGSYQTGMVSLGANSFVLPAISDYANMNHGIVFEFLNTGTNVRNTATTGLFQGNLPINVGGSEDVYYRDADSNGIFTGSDARNFGGAAGFAANAAFQLEGEPVPEPASLAVLGLGVAALIRRRRK